MDKNLTAKVLAVQAELNAPKGKFNKFGGYKYRSCEDIMEAVKPLLVKQGLLLTVTDEVVAIGERIYIKATATITDGTACVSTTAYAREEDTKKGMDASQITGSASSYARKYALNGLLCIDETQDADATNTHGQGQAQKQQAQPAKVTVDVAIQEVQMAKSSQEVADLWAKYRMFANDAVFKSVVKDCGTNLKNKKL